MKRMEKLKYINNCISRILMAPCHPSRVQDRNNAIGWAVYLAADNPDAGFETAHEYLVDACKAAESGEYAVPQPGGAR